MCIKCFNMTQYYYYYFFFHTQNINKEKFVRNSLAIHHQTSIRYTTETQSGHSCRRAIIYLTRYGSVWGLWKNDQTKSNGESWTIPPTSEPYIILDIKWWDRRGIYTFESGFVLSPRSYQFQYAINNEFFWYGKTMDADVQWRGFYNMTTTLRTDRLCPAPYGHS